MSFSRTRFDQFTQDLLINTKERGIIPLGQHLLGAQRYVLDEMQKGFDAGIHDFTILKCRQLGISTLFLAVDQFTIMENPGMQGVIVTQDEGAKHQFRATLNTYYNSLPVEWQLDKVEDNRDQTVYESGSMLLYRVAGTRVSPSSGNLGRSASPSLIHATEVARWVDPEGVASLRSSMSEQNPNRLYVWESTANGFNMFENMWRVAKTAVTQKAIFVSWHSHEFYRAPRHSDMYKAFWGANGQATRDERERARAVKLLYGIDITPEMLAWYRWYEAEKCAGNDNLAKQEMPWTEDEAFIATGSNFFTAEILTYLTRKIRGEAAPTYWRLKFYSNFVDTELIKSEPRAATMWIWEEPVRNGYYVMGADPAYGSSENADRFVISVWRCYADRVVQVAEFVDADMSPHQFAWVMVYLAGYYTPCLYNLEINGPGQAVENEISNLKKQVAISTAPHDVALRNILGNMRVFFWSRIDSISVVPSARHTVTTAREIERYMGYFKDYVERRMADVRSEGLVNEMKEFHRDDTGSLGATSRGKDDRCIAAGLAMSAWNDKLRTMLLQRGYMYAAVHRDTEQQFQYDPTQAAVNNLFLRLGIKREARQEIPGVKHGTPRASSRRPGGVRTH